MNNIILIVLAILFYSAAICLQVTALIRKKTLSLRLFWLLGWLGCVAHAMLLYHLIDIGHLQNLSVVNLFSLVAWLVAVLILLATLTKPVANLGMLIFPVAIISVILAMNFPGSNLLNTAAHPKELFHIVLSTFAFSVLCIAALQAVLLAIQEWWLRHKQTNYLMQILPPLEIMETLLFQMLLLGFILLTIVLVTSWWWFRPLFTNALWEKSVLALFAWGIFAILLIGHSYFGWRGRLAIRYTLMGVSLVMLTYYGSQLI